MQSSLFLALRRAKWSFTGYDAHRISKLLEESQWWSRSKLEDFRDEKLKNLIHHCYQNVPYYRRTMDKLGLLPNSIQSAKDLQKLPVLTKTEVRANWQDMQARNICENETSLTKTGGTTGEPMQIVKDIKNTAWASMAFERGMSWAGLTPTVKCVQLTGGSLWAKDKDWWHILRNKFSGKINLPAFDLGRHNFLEYASVIRKSQVRYMLGYSTSVYHLSRLLLEKGESLELDAVFTTATQLYPEWAEVIRKAMNCSVFSYYGCGECNSMGYQCKEGEEYHIPEEHVVLEVESDTGETKLAGSGEAILTDLDNYAMPLLRYRNGDLLTLGNPGCSCGRSLGIISKLDGRKYEFFFSMTGNKVSAGFVTHIMRNLEGIDEFQFRQKTQNQVCVLLVSQKNLSQKDESYIQHSVQHYLGKDFKVAINRVENIPRSKAQKLQMVVNEMVQTS